jgi:hypothetical protein
MKSTAVDAHLMGKSTAHGPFDGKLKRFATSLVLPIDRNRAGECKRCGACCKFLVECPFLRPARDDPNAYECRAYLVRPLQCRKYPRTKAEQIHEPCGYRFSDPTERNKTQDR